MQIFISYSTKNKEFVDRIDNFFHKDFGIRLIRDIRDLKYRGNVDDFMKRVRTVDYVLVLISKDFLESKFCMYEMTELMKDLNHKEKILPIILGDINLFDMAQRLELSEYWDKAHKKLKKLIKRYTKVGELTEIVSEIENLKRIKIIRSQVNDFLAFLTSMRLVKLQEMESDNFQEIAEALNISKQQVVAQSKVNVLDKGTSLKEIQSTLSVLLRDEFERIFEQLRTVIDPEGAVSSDLILLEARYNSLQRNQKQGIVSEANYNVTFNRIRHAVLSVIEDLKKDDIKLQITTPVASSNEVQLSSLLKNIEGLVELIQINEVGNTKQGYQDARRILIEKVNYLRPEIAKLTSSAHKFQLIKELEDTEKDLEALEKEMENAPTNEVKSRLISIKQELNNYLT